MVALSLKLGTRSPRFSCISNDIMYYPNRNVRPALSLCQASVSVMKHYHGCGQDTSDRPLTFEFSKGRCDDFLFAARQPPSAFDPQIEKLRESPIIIFLLLFNH